MIRNIEQSLKNKFGPLPVWAWALITGAGIYVYRARKGAYSTGSAATDTTSGTAADTGSGTTPQDPVTLQPGESVYDPNTGQLVGGSASPQEPLTLDPGQGVYDPNSGQLDTFPSITTTSKPTPKKAGKHKPKKKAQHHKGKAAPTGVHGKGRNRSVAKLVHPRAGKPRVKPHLRATKGKGTGNVPRHPAAPSTNKAQPRNRQITSGHVSKPAMRQRPAAGHHVNGAQRVTTHPARAQTPARHTTPVPTHRRRRKK